MSLFRDYLGNIHGTLLKIHRNRKLIKLLSAYLEDGLYLNSDSGDCVFSINSSPIRNTFSALNSCNRLAIPIARFIYRMVRYRVNSRNVSSSFKGQKFIISSSATEYKVFDDKLKRVLTIYSSTDKLALIERNKEYFSQWFSLPKTLSVDWKKLLICEQLIEKRDFDVKSAFQQLLNAYVKYVTVVSAKAVPAHNELNRISRQQYFDFNDLLQDSNNFDIFIIQTHGDFWSSNVLFDGEIYYITDFENVGRRFFLYDLFFYMYSEWRLFRRDHLVLKYLEGDYDEAFKKIFNSFSIDYSINMRELYFGISLFYAMEERWRNDEFNKNIVLQFAHKYLHSIIKGYVS